ncbi:hypothetical protein [Polaromonas sp.]|uniref:hypothetical protein n=1 Tax=Polaromonas sp. TaxID=1869339 RepID=UPI0027302C39|nr:hypothetical protein [Polaromonas sp.]MDP1740936.1 hypothetical protein [Polaromonas sp.]
MSFEISVDALKQLDFRWPPAKVAQVIQLVKAVWELSPKRHSLYFRGSVQRYSTHAPIDLDMYYVLQGPDMSMSDSVQICLKLHEGFPDLPRPDLSIFTRDNLLDPDRRQMTRLILQYDGTFVCGENLLPAIPPVEFSEANADLIWKKQTGIACAKISAISSPAFVSLDSNLQAYICSSVAKSVLRLVMHEFMRVEKDFVRDTEKCAQLIARKYPDLLSAVEDLGRIAPHKPAHPREVLRAALPVYERLMWHADQTQCSPRR